MFGSAFAFSNLFLNSDDPTAPFSTPNLSDESLWYAEILSSCSDDGIGQPSKLRARNLVCPPDPLALPTTQLQAPEIPGLPEIENGLTKTP